MRKVLLSLSAFLFILTVQAQDVTHLVKQGESLFSLAKKHNTTIDAIIKQNNLGGNGIKIGQKLILPNSTNVPAKTESPSAPTGTAVKARVHTVVKGESLYAITKKYGITLQDLKAWNNINETNIQPGQKLVVSKVDQSAIYNPSMENKKAELKEEQAPVTLPTARPAAPTAALVETPVEQPVALKEITKSTESEHWRNTSISPVDYPAIFYQYPTKGLKISKNRGVANYLFEATSGNQFLAFYNGAEQGSVIRVTNLLSQKTIFVKVVGKLPAADASNDVMVKLTAKAAEELEAAENKFLVEVSAYTAP